MTALIAFYNRLRTVFTKVTELLLFQTCFFRPLISLFRTLWESLDCFGAGCQPFTSVFHSLCMTDSPLVRYLLTSLLPAWQAESISHIFHSVTQCTTDSSYRVKETVSCYVDRKLVISRKETGKLLETTRQNIWETYEHTPYNPFDTKSETHKPFYI